MKRKRIAIITVVALASVISICYVLSVQELLNNYKTGFSLTGTYQICDANPVGNECLVFMRPEKSESNVFFHYRQYAFNEKGTYINVKPNLYKLVIKDSDIDGNYILVGSKSICLIYDEYVVEYEKVSDNAIFSGEVLDRL